MNREGGEKRKMRKSIIINFVVVSLALLLCANAYAANWAWDLSDGGGWFYVYSADGTVDYSATGGVGDSRCYIANESFTGADYGAGGGFGAMSFTAPLPNLDNHYYGIKVKSSAPGTIANAFTAQVSYGGQAYLYDNVVGDLVWPSVDAPTFASLNSGWNEFVFRFTDENRWLWRNWSDPSGTGPVYKLPEGAFANLAGELGFAINDAGQAPGYGLVALSFDDVAVSTSPIPEPSTVMLLTTGLGGLFVISTRKRRR